MEPSKKVDHAALTANDSHLAAIVAEYQSLLDSGRIPSQEEFLQKYPEYAVELLPYLEAIDFVGRAIPQTVKENSAPVNR
ncbi:MAG: hypothetical protein U0930_19975 [Pirellulales bacterium]